MRKTPTEIADEAVENPLPTSTALVLTNPGGAPAISGGRGIKGYVSQVMPMLKLGVSVGGGWIGSNIIRGYVSAPVAGMVFGKDKVTPGQALLLDWVFQLGGAISAYRFLPKGIGLPVAGGMVANQIVATLKQLTPAPAAGQQPSLLTRSLDVTAFRSVPPGGGMQGIMPRNNRSLAGIMPKPMRY